MPLPKNSLPDVPFYREPPKPTSQPAAIQQATPAPVPEPVLEAAAAPEAILQESVAQEASAQQEALEEPLIAYPNPEELEQADVHTSLQEAQDALSLSSKIYIMGADRRARFITHRLASIPQFEETPQLLAQHPSIISQWGEEGRSITIHRSEGRLDSREIPCPEYVGPPLGQRRYAPGRGTSYINNLIITSDISDAAKALRHMRRRINNRTTVCLLQDGLGLVEYLNDTVFKDPVTRPTYVLGNMSHVLARSNDRSHLSLAQKSEGYVTLYGCPRSEPQHPTLQHISSLTQGHAQTQHLARILGLAPDLEAQLYTETQFLRRKLPVVVFSAMADSISVMLGCRYGEIEKSSHGQRLWQDMYRETVDIITSLPEFQRDPAGLSYFTGSKFKYELGLGLRRRARATSPWISRVELGLPVPVDFCNGWLIRQAKQAGVPTPAHSMALYVLKAKQATRLEKLRSEIPMYQPYLSESELQQSEDNREIYEI